MECETAVVGEQGGEGDQVGPVAVPVLLEHVAGGGKEEGGAAAAHAAGVSRGVAAVHADQAVQRAAGVQLVGLAQCERQSDGLQRLGGRQAHEGAVAAAPSAAASSAEEESLLALLQR